MPGAEDDGDIVSSLTRQVWKRYFRCTQRQARIDAHGALHHIVMRGIGHRYREIFEDNRDREDFLERISGLLMGTITLCYA